MNDVRTRALTDDELAQLESERDFLLESLADLEREHAAGDLDDSSFRTLEADYTARAARVIRSIESAEVEVVDDGRSSSRIRRLVWIGAVGIFAVFAGVLVARSSGSRNAGEVGTGDIRRSSQQLLLDASDLAAAGDIDEAIELYGEVIDLVPADPEAWTYRGWLQYQQGDEGAARSDLAEAVAVAEEYPDAWVFQSIVAYRSGDIETATESLMTFDALEPPPAMRQLVDGQRLRQNITAALAETGELDVAIALYDSALDVRPDDPLLNAERGWLLALVADQADRAGDVDSAAALTEESVKWLDGAVELDPDLPDARAYRAVVRLELLDDRAGASEDVDAYRGSGATRGDLDAILAQSGL